VCLASENRTGTQREVLTFVTALRTVCTAKRCLGKVLRGSYFVEQSVADPATVDDKDSAVSDES